MNTIYDLELDKVKVCTNFEFNRKVLVVYQFMISKKDTAEKMFIPGSVARMQKNYQTWKLNLDSTRVACVQ